MNSYALLVQCHVQFCANIARSDVLVFIRKSIELQTDKSRTVGCQMVCLCIGLTYIYSEAAYILFYINMLPHYKYVLVLYINTPSDNPHF